MTKVKDTMNLPTVAVETEDKDLTSEEWEEINDKVPDRFELLQERYGGRGPQSYWEYQQYLDDFVQGAEDLDDCETSRTTLLRTAKTTTKSAMATLTRCVGNQAPGETGLRSKKRNS